jgi:hypothetical protein
VQDNQQMLKGVFIILIKLPRYVSAANCQLQGVTRSLQATPVLSAPRVDVSYGSLGVVSRHAITARGNLMSTVKPQFTNASHHEQIGLRTKNVSDDKRCLE